MTDTCAAVAYPKARTRDRVAARRRAMADVARRQIDIEDWIAAAKAREEGAVADV